MVIFLKHFGIIEVVYMITAQHSLSNKGNLPMKSESKYELSAIEAPSKAMAIANTFLEKSFESGSIVTNMKLQKLCFFAYGWYAGFMLAKESKVDLLFEDDILAWQYGPVIRSVYDEFKVFGNRRIDRLGIEYVIVNDASADSNPFKLLEREVKLDKSKPENAIKLEIIDFVWNKYGNYSALDLSAITHKPGSPWSLTYKGNSSGDFEDYNVINSFLIADYYANKILNSRKRKTVKV